MAYQNVIQKRIIQERDVAAQALRESERKIRHLADSMPQLVWMADSSGKIDYYNERRNEFNGFTKRPDRNNFV